jgi:hypothetical protein
MIALEPYTVTPYAGMQATRILKTLVASHRKAINQAAHAAAVRFEIETRDKWLRELTQALEAGATFQELQERIAKLAS